MRRGIAKKTVLLILDGWGLSSELTGNAVAIAKTPAMDTLSSDEMFNSLHAAGEAVGLPWGEMGNSEVGHINIGSGRVVISDYEQISVSFKNRSVYENSVLKNAVKTKGDIHLIGVITNATIHGNIEHLLALAKYFLEKGKSVFIHLITDGRDTPPKAALKLYKKYSPKFKEISQAKIVSISGRYYAMDRDKRWDRTQLAYRAIALADGNKAADFESGVKNAYNKGLSDEFIEPTVLPDHPGVKSGDLVLFTNFRTDRALQLTRAFVEENFKGFARSKIKNLGFISMVEYQHNLGVEPLFSVVDLNNPRSNPLNNCLAEVLDKNGLTQLHIAETEKYAHVTYFFNAGRDKPFKNEKRVLIPSPKVATYDKVPEMSAEKIKEEFVKNYKKISPDFSVVNFANADMVGHTGDFKATVKACETVDRQVKDIFSALDSSTVLIVTADHGNAEQMKNFQSKGVNKEHTTNPVPLLICDKEKNQKLLWVEKDTNHKLKLASRQPIGLLADIAPTVLDILKIKKPKEMTGESLLNIVD